MHLVGNFSTNNRRALGLWLGMAALGWHEEESAVWGQVEGKKKHRKNVVSGAVWHTLLTNVSATRQPRKAVLKAYGET